MLDIYLRGLLPVFEIGLPPLSHFTRQGGKLVFLNCSRQHREHFSNMLFLCVSFLLRLLIQLHMDKRTSSRIFFSSSSISAPQ